MTLHPLLFHARLLAGLLAAAFLAAPEVRAATFCATSSAQLQSALDAADSNGQDDVIRIAQGTYAVPTGESFHYRGGPTFGGDDNDLAIVGGYVFANGDPCGLLPAGASALDTLLDGENRERVMQIYAGNGSDVTILGLGFLAGSPSEGGATRGGGLVLSGFNSTPGTFIVERSLFIANEAEYGAAVEANDARVIRFVNNLVAGNNTLTGGAAVELVQNDQTGIYVINNTIVNNSTSGPSSNSTVTGLYLYVSGTSRAFVANNILFGNEFNDIYFAGPGFTTSRNNSIEAPVGSADSSQGNVAIAPVFAGGLLDFNLAPGSVLADIGLTPAPFIPFPPAFEENWSLPGEDLDGGPRITNGKVDIGAYETREPRLFKDGFE